MSKCERVIDLVHLNCCCFVLAFDHHALDNRIICFTTYALTPYRTLERLGKKAAAQPRIDKKSENDETGKKYFQNN